MTTLRIDGVDELETNFYDIIIYCMWDMRLAYSIEGGRLCRSIDEDIEVYF